MQADECDTNLALAIGGGEFKSNKNHGVDEEKPFNCLALFPNQEADGRVRKQPRSVSRSEDSEEEARRGRGVDHRAVGRRKKLRLCQEQLALLEDSFTEHNILNLNQKQELASQLNIQPRQVEVWFQNRRARTKSKQTEGDCKSLKNWCEKLSEENQKLREEIEELRSRNSTHKSPFHMQMPTLNICPSCRRRRVAESICGGGRGNKDGFCVKKEQDNWSLYIAGQ